MFVSNSRKMFRKLIRTSFILVLLLSCYPQYPEDQPRREKDSAYQFYSIALNELDAGHPQMALENVNRAITLNDRLAIFYILKARIYEDLGEPVPAIRNYQISLKLHSHDPEALRRIAILYSRTDQPDQALQYFRRAYGQRPQQHTLLLEMADLSLKSGYFEKAHGLLDEYASAVNVIPKDPDALYFRLRGKLAFREGHYEKVLHYFEQPKSLGEFSQDEIIMMLETCFKLGKFENAFRVLSRVRPGQLSESQSKYYKGLYYYYAQNYNDARLLLEYAGNFTDIDDEVFYYLGKIYLREGQTEKARAAFKTYTSLDPDPKRLLEINEILLPQIN